MQQINRIVPRVGADAYKTYEVAAPLPTHWRPASCAEVDCLHHLQGWTSVIHVATDFGARQARYIREQSGRRFTEQFSEALMTVTFTFPAGQRCFASGDHRVSLEREPLFLVRGGDWRGNPLRIPTRQHTSAEDWRDDFGEHQQRVADTIERG